MLKERNQKKGECPAFYQTVIQKLSKVYSCLHYDSSDIQID